MTKNEHTSSTTKGAQPGARPAQETLTPQDNSASLSSVSQNRSANASPTPGSAYSVELHIEELRLHGFAAGDRQRIGESFEIEMNRLFSNHDVPPSLAQGGEIALLSDLEFNLAASARPEAIGIQIARVIFRSFSHE